MLFAEWRLVNSGAADGYVNMAIDEATLVLVGEGRAPPTVRLYCWDSPCFTVGYRQSVAGRKPLRNYQYVRRLTGGATCRHGGDLSYSLVVSLADTLIPARVVASYERITAGVIEGLRILGIDARYASPNEVQVDQHIVATAAQARRRGVLLHQGTVALEPCVLEEDPGLTCVRMTPLSQIVGGVLDLGDAAQALGMGFERALGVDLSPGILFAKEKRLAREFLRDKYARSEWNLAR